MTVLKSSDMFIVDTSVFHCLAKVSILRLAQLHGHGDDDEVSADEQEKFDITAVCILRDFEQLRQNCEKVKFVWKCIFDDGNVVDVGRWLNYE